LLPFAAKRRAWELGEVQGTSFFQQLLVKNMDFARRALHETFAESISIWPVSATG
jgi:hypothetical protein